jgi:hypothetical protein
MVAIAVIARHALLEIEVGQVSDQLRENGSADIHPPLFRRGPDRPGSIFSRFQFKSFFGKTPLFY